jgi:hypothetical protein
MTRPFDYVGKFTQLSKEKDNLSINSKLTARRRKKILLPKAVTEPREFPHNNEEIADGSPEQSTQSYSRLQKRHEYYRGLWAKDRLSRFEEIAKDRLRKEFGTLARRQHSFYIDDSMRVVGVNRSRV